MLLSGYPAVSHRIPKQNRSQSYNLRPAATRHPTTRGRGNKSPFSVCHLCQPLRLREWPINTTVSGEIGSALVLEFLRFPRCRR